MRPEEERDQAAVRLLVEQAFDRSNEAELVDLLRPLKGVWSFVAEEHGVVVGHIMFSPVSVTAATGTWQGVGLAPLSVLPRAQNRGIGRALATFGLEEMKSAGRPYVVVLGEPDYYMPLGFETARTRGVFPTWPGIDDKYVMIQILDAKATQGINGTLRYHSLFDSV